MHTAHLNLKETEEAVEGLSPGRASELIRVSLELSTVVSTVLAYNSTPHLVMHPKSCC